MQSVHAMEYYAASTYLVWMNPESVTRMQSVHAMNTMQPLVWMNPENSRLCEISQSQEDRHLVVPLYQEPGVVKVIETEDRRGCWEGKWGAVFNGNRVSGLQDENIVEICCRTM